MNVAAPPLASLADAPADNTPPADARPGNSRQGPAAPTPRRSARPWRRGALLALVLGVHLAGFATLATLDWQRPAASQRPVEVTLILAPQRPAPAPPAPRVEPKPQPAKPVPPKAAVQPKPRPVAAPKPAAPEPAVAPERTTEAPTALAAPEPQPAPAVAPAPPAPPAAAVEPAPAPVVAARFDAAYLNNPAPSYPALARRMQEQGKVLLRVLVTAEGRPGKIELSASSGSARLDHAAEDAVRRWRFVAARQGERAIESWVIVPIVFKLEGS